MQKLISFALLTSSLVLNLSCATVPDVPACVKVSPGKGYCRTIISGKRQLVTDTELISAPDGKKYTWFDLEPRSVILPFWAWKEMKTFIIQSCKENEMGGCSEIKDWQRSVDDIDGWLAESYK